MTPARPGPALPLALSLSKGDNEGPALPLALSLSKGNATGPALSNIEGPSQEAQEPIVRQAQEKEGRRVAGQRRRAQSSAPVEPRAVFIVGPTAVGKTELALALAERFGGEIIGADSRQLYRGMDIGTAKPTSEQRARVPHHLVDILEPDQPFTLAQYLDLARAAIAEVRRRGRLPFVVGGTGLYIWALLRGVQVPRVPPNWELRHALEQRAAREGPSSLHAELARLDPTAAARIDPRNLRRLVRALEVAWARQHSVPGPSPAPDDAGPEQRQDPIQGPSKRPSPEAHPLILRQAQDEQARGSEGPALVSEKGAIAGPGPAGSIGALVLGLTMPRPILYRRADDRIEAMVAAGWPEEVRRLLARGYSPSLPALSALGYREMVAFVQGQLDLPTAIQRIKHATHRFIRHQYTWFRRPELGVRWFDLTDPGSYAALVEAIAAHISWPC